LNLSLEILCSFIKWQCFWLPKKRILQALSWNNSPYQKVCQFLNWSNLIVRQIIWKISGLREMISILPHLIIAFDQWKTFILILTFFQSVTKTKSFSQGHHFSKTSSLLKNEPKLIWNFLRQTLSSSSLNPNVYLCFLHFNLKESFLHYLFGKPLMFMKSKEFLDGLFMVVYFWMKLERYEYYLNYKILYNLNE